MGIFGWLEREGVEELIKLYEDFIENPEDPELGDRGLKYDRRYGIPSLLSKEVSRAAGKAGFIFLGEVSVEEAEYLLDSLKRLRDYYEENGWP